MPPLDVFYPTFRRDAAFEALRSHDAPWLPAIKAIAARHGLEGTARLFDQGSCVLFGVGDLWVVKLFEPWFLAHYHTERTLLAHVDGALPVPTPQLHAADIIEGWGYVVMSRLAGNALNQERAAFGPTDRIRIARQVGTLAAALHERPVTGLESLAPSWPAFIAEQRAACVARHQGHGLVSASTLENIRTLVAQTEIPMSSQGLLHTEMTDQNLLVAQDDEGWRLSGLVDFEPAMLGAPEYDLVAPAIFIARGDADLLDQTLEAYGYSASERNGALQARQMAYTLLHRYSHLGFFWRQISHDPFPDDLNMLMDAFFPIQGVGSR
jgi:hygromycin-B 7''-O-kinase